MKKDPVHKEGSKWFFYDETWARRLGPFNTEAQARNEFEKYCKELDYGNKNIIDKEFEGNVRIVVDKDTVKIWVCKKGESIFRFKFIGKVHGNDNEFVVIGK